MNRATLTALYLDEVKRRGARASELAGTVAESDGVLLNSFYPGVQWLSRPLLAGHEELGALYADVERLRAAMVSLPGRLYGGDLAAFARAVGATDYQVSAAARGQAGPVSRQARADLYEDAAGFHVLEVNMGSALGGMEIADVCRDMLRHPLLAEFADAHGLGYVDTQREQVSNILLDCGFEPGSRPMVAVTDWPSSYENRLGAYMHKLAARWRELGLDAHACHIGELEVRGGRVWLGGRAVDIVARMFLIDYLLEADAPALMDPVLDAAAGGAVKIWTPLDTELFGSKAALAMISDERNRHLFGAAELASFDRIVPWTRMVRPGQVTLEDGQRVELLDYAAEHRRDLVLKPSLRWGGQEVLPGWHRDTSSERWRRQLAAASGGPYVLQRRIRPVPELFPGEGGEPAGWIVAWGVFTVDSGYGGIIIRAATADCGIAVLNLSYGALLGCCLSTQPGPGPGGAQEP
jgi:hypothetical protein